MSTENKGQNWNGLALISFRFAFSYFVLYFQYDVLMVTVNWLRWVPGIPWNAASHAVDFLMGFWHTVVPFVGKNILHLQSKIEDCGWPYADNTYGWVYAFTLLLFAAGATLIWSVADRKRRNYEYLQEWFRLILRVCLAQALFGYGIEKVIKVQFRDIALSTLEAKLGDLGPMELLWSFMGYSRDYCLFGGLSEVIPGIMLLFRRLTLLGAVLAAAVMLNVFVLNVCYDVRVKLYSFHLLLAALTLMAPDAMRLFNMFINRRAEPRQAPPFFKRIWYDRLICLIPFLTLITLWEHGSYAVTSRKVELDRPPFYGIWDVDEFSEDGKIQPPLTTDSSRWEKIVFNERNWMYMRKMNQNGDMFFIEWSKDKKTISIGKIKNTQDVYQASVRNQTFKPDWTSRDVLEIEKPAKDQIVLKGRYQGHLVEIKLHRVDEEKLPLLKQTFRWITNPEDYGNTARE